MKPSTETKVYDWSSDQIANPRDLASQLINVCINPYTITYC